MTRKRIGWLISSVAVAALGIGAVRSLTAFAEEASPFASHHEHMVKHIDAALDAGGVTPAEREIVHAARDRAVAAVAGERDAHRAHMEQLLTLFTADRLDQKALGDLRASEEQLGQKAAVAITAALTDAHDALTSVERQKIAEFVVTQADGHSLKDHPHRADFVKGRMTSHVNGILDKANIAAVERPQILAAVEHVVATFAAEGDAHRAHMNAALTLWKKDQIDPAAVQKLQQDGVAARRTVGDAVVQAIYDIHDALTPTERQALVTQLRAHLVAMHGQHG